jgi:hypothetical protein
MLFLSSMAEHQRAGETWEYSTKRATENCCETLSISAVATFLGNAYVAATEMHGTA